MKPENGAFPMPDTLILGIGNPLLTDDGAGIHTLERLRGANLPSGVELLDGGTLSFNLLEHVEAAPRLVVIDAAHLGEPPGTVKVLEDLAMDHWLRSGKRSVHEVGLADVLDMARLTGGLPEPRALVAIEPESLAWGERPTATVTAAIDQAVAETLYLLARWS